MTGDDGYEDEAAPGAHGLADLLAQFQDAEHRLEEAAAEASATVVTGSAAGGQVTVDISGDLEAVSVHIDPSVVDAGDVSLLEDLVLAALRDALHQVAELQADVAGSIDGPAFDLSGLLGNLGLGNLGGALGLDNLSQIAAQQRMPGLADLSSLVGGLGLGLGAGGDEGDDGDDGPPEGPGPHAGSDPGPATGA